MIGCWWWAHNYPTVTVGLDTPWESLQCWISQHFSPTAQIESGLLRARTNFQCEGWHYAELYVSGVGCVKPADYRQLDSTLTAGRANFTVGELLWSR